MASRGPNTGRGKAISSRNALKHGFGAGEPVVRQVESLEDWYRHVERVIADLKPEGYVETMLAERAAEIFWRLRRVSQYEADTISVALDEMPEEYAATLKYAEKMSGKPFEEGRTPEHVQMQAGVRMIPDRDTLNIITRYESHLHRQLLQTLHELEAMQDRRRGHQTPLARIDFTGPPGA